MIQKRFICDCMGSSLGKRCDNWEGARRRRSRRAHRYDVAIEKTPKF